MKLRIENVHKSYRVAQHEPLGVLRGMNFSFPEDGFVSICGPSGCGKSTLLNILGGLDRPDSGKLFWGEEDVSTWSDQKLAWWRNSTIGFIFQAYHLLPELTALENVELPAALGRKNRSKEAQELISLVGLAGRMHHRPSELSGGEQQRIALARALVNDPPVLLADEPTGNLDGATSREMIDLLLDLALQRKKILILVTHDAELAARATIRLRISDGHLQQL